VFSARLNPSSWGTAVFGAVALIGLALHAFLTGPEAGASRGEVLVGRLFHGVLLLAVLVWLARLNRLTAGHAARKAPTAVLLGVAALAGTALLARDFGII